MPKGSFDLKAWARIGATRRVEEIRAEMQRIQAVFPDLGPSRTSSARVTDVDAVGVHRRERNQVADRGDDGLEARRKRFTMSDDARRRISLAQKRRWRKVRAAR